MIASNGKEIGALFLFVVCAACSVVAVYTHTRDKQSNDVVNLDSLEVWDKLDVQNSIGVSYHQMVEGLTPLGRFMNGSTGLSLSTLSPFCDKFVVPEMSDDAEPVCIRWEEHELDMLLMYLDLLASGLDKKLATAFYEEIRCLSRANIFPIPELKAWEVCFSYDYSDVVGSLLAKYIHQGIDVNRNNDLTPVTRFSLGSARSHSSLLLMLFQNSAALQTLSREAQLKTSCCRSCAQSNYFVNVGMRDCLNTPFGRHCCHIACKSLSRLKVGASSSISYCCPRCNPQQCSSV